MSKKHIILCIIINRTDLIYYTNLIYTCDILNNDIVKWGDGDFFFLQFSLRHCPLVQLKMEKVFLTYSEYVALKDLFIPSTLRVWLRHWSASTSADLMWQSWDWSRWKLQTSKTGNEIQITADSLYKSASGGLAYWNKPLTQEVPIGICGSSGA